jgi:hypothetical protein
MQPSVPDYIYILYIDVVLETKSRNNSTKENFSKARRTAVTNAMKKKSCGTEGVASNTKTRKINTSLW